jgi:hypothetical protein
MPMCDGGSEVSGGVGEWVRVTWVEGEGGWFVIRAIWLEA